MKIVSPFRFRNLGVRVKCSCVLQFTQEDNDKNHLIF